MFLLGPLRVDLGSLSVTDGRATTPLTRTEAALIERLLEAAGGVVSRDSLLADVWGYGPNIKTRTLITTLSRVRAKIEVDPAEPKHLLTERGQGVSLVGAEPVVRERAAASVALVGRREALEAVRQGLNAGPVLIAG
ncbi:MAG: winged helix-turn-helix transcriptional regulator, partial [Myxococcales bacterium]|nr:winged helix-turn-helix transcriptional regulator [Myxococcales bacterium]